MLRYFKKRKKDKYNALNEIDKKIMKYLSKSGGYFLELGANDGVNQSNTLRLEREYGWKGLLIEAIPHIYFKCKKNRSRKNDFYYAAVVGPDYEADLVKMMYANLMTVGETSVLDKKNHLERAARLLPSNEEVITIGVPAFTLTSILDDVSAPRCIDFFSLDVEGAELSVLEGINFEKYTFSYLLVETKDFDSINDILSANDYELIEKLSFHDYLFEKKHIPETKLVP